MCHMNMISSACLWDHSYRQITGPRLFWSVQLSVHTFITQNHEYCTNFCTLFLVMISTIKRLTLNICISQSHTYVYWLCLLTSAPLGFSFSPGKLRNTASCIFPDNIAFTVFILYCKIQLTKNVCFFTKWHTHIEPQKQKCSVAVPWQQFFVYPFHCFRFHARLPSPCNQQEELIEFLFCISKRCMRGQHIWQ